MRNLGCRKIRGMFMVQHQIPHLFGMTSFFITDKMAIAVRSPQRQVRTVFSELLPAGRLWSATVDLGVGAKCGLKEAEKGAIFRPM